MDTKDIHTNTKTEHLSEFTIIQGNIENLNLCKFYENIFFCGLYILHKQGFLLMTDRRFVFGQKLAELSAAPKLSICVLTFDTSISYSHINSNTFDIIINRKLQVRSKTENEMMIC